MFATPDNTMVKRENFLHESTRIWSNRSNDFCSNDYLFDYILLKIESNGIEIATYYLKFFFNVNIINLFDKF